MTKAIVYGPYPPMLGPTPEETVRTVRKLVATGADVEVISPLPSAAHRHVNLSRPDGALRFLRSVAGADEVVLHLDPVPFATASRKAQAGRVALGLALRRAGRVTVHLPALDAPLPAAWVDAVLEGVDRVVAASEADRDALVAAGAPAGVVEVRDAEGDGTGAAGAAAAGSPAATGHPGGAAGAPAEPWRLGPEPTREEIQAEVARRAASRRQADSEARYAPGGDARRRAADAALALRAIAPLGRAPARSAKPGVGSVKRAVQRLVGWQVDPVIEHVNRLHRATVEALEARDQLDR